MTKLFLRVEAAETEHENATAMHDAILSLCNENFAVAVLLREFAATSISAEKQWREIEAMPEFKATYTDRDSCRADFLREYWKGRK